MPRKVLVVDDERDLADLAEALFESRGLAVRVAYSAAEALAILASDGDIDAVFSDVMMPGMTGLQLADTVSAQYPHLKIVLTSGYTLPALRSSHAHYPLTPKPYTIDGIIALLRR